MTKDKINRLGALQWSGRINNAFRQRRIGDKNVLVTQELRIPWSILKKTDETTGLEQREAFLSKLDVLDLKSKFKINAMFFSCILFRYENFISSSSVCLQI